MKFINWPKLKAIDISRPSDVKPPLAIRGLCAWPILIGGADIQVQILCQLPFFNILTIINYVRIKGV